MPRFSVIALKRVQARQLARVIRVRALAVLDDGGRRIQAAALLKPRLRDAVDLDQEIEASVRIYSRCHVSSP